MKTKTFSIDNYGKKSTFASFLPGIAGVKGIPIWCYYVNRGQCVVSFGVDNKDKSIMEFYPAQQAYQNVKTTGFRTFIKKNGTVTEAFASEKVPHRMDISMNGLVIEEQNEERKTSVRVTYYTLPGEKIGGLVRKVEIKNEDSAPAYFEILDGMPAVIPYGVSLFSMKNMGETAKASMQVEDARERKAYYRVRATMDDTAAVMEIEGGNFSVGYLPDGTLLQPVVDPKLVFSYDSAMREAIGFEENSLKELMEKEQNTSNEVPCSFFGIEKELACGESICFYELIGQAEKKEIFGNFVNVKRDEAYFERKKRESDELAETLCGGIDTHTASEDFDAYCKYTYMDNVLRGGYPMQLGNHKVFYVYSRKHGDLERDYNYFSMLPEFFSQGNGNFRDVNQNRRCDTFFAPFVERENIREFYSFIQLDGYNPLSVEKLTYSVEKKKGENLLKENASVFRQDMDRDRLLTFITGAFTPGALYHILDEMTGEAQTEKLFTQIIDQADGLVNGNFGEGYWTDHWTYNLDLVNDYLEVFPEKEREMLYEEAYTTFLSQIKVNHREKRYVETKKGLRQYQALDEEHQRHTAEKLVKAEKQTGDVLTMTLLEKLVLLCSTKFATLDAYGMGIEMEGGKPGWYDALNGMPGRFGSSMAETYELARMLDYTIRAMKKYPGKLHLIEELYRYMKELDQINREEAGKIRFGLEHTSLTPEQIRESGEILSFWNRVNDAKEAYADTVFEGLTGAKKELETEEAVKILEGFLETVNCGIQKACAMGDGICPTYFMYDVPEYEKTEEGYRPLRFELLTIPYFLEGPVRYLKLKNSREKKAALYEKVKNSDLYDQKLSMYKVNASLAEASFELGRAKSFTPGWLENESIWLHMEYKYLLELIRNGLYPQFFEDFKKAAVPFLDPDVYGRSIYENSSFIASSSNPNRNYHGKGFVARLSGSTVEFISMWKQMMFGSHIMLWKDGELTFAPQPAIPAYLVPEDGRVSAMLFGKTKVTYQFPAVADYIPGQYEIGRMEFVYENGTRATVEGAFACGRLAEDLRNGKMAEVFINIL